MNVNKKDIFLFSFYLCLHISFKDVSSTVITVKTATETLHTVFDSGSCFSDRHSFRVKCFDSFIFAFYSETIWNNASKIFALDPRCSEEKCLNRNMNSNIWKLFFVLSSLSVISFMNLITAVCAQIEWEEHHRPVDQTETAFLVKLCLLLP